MLAFIIKTDQQFISKLEIYYIFFYFNPKLLTFLRLPMPNRMTVKLFLLFNHAAVKNLIVW